MSVCAFRLHRQNAQTSSRLPAFSSRKCVAEYFPAVAAVHDMVTRFIRPLLLARGAWHRQAPVSAFEEALQVDVPFYTKVAICQYNVYSITLVHYHISSLPGRNVEQTRRAYRELVAAGLMEPVSTFAGGPERLTT